AGIGIDWTLCLLISSAFFPDPTINPDSVTGFERVLLAGHPMATRGVWALQHVVLVATIGTTIGHRLMGLRVVRVDGARYVGVVKDGVRTALLALIIPAGVWDEEGRGLHDRAAGTRLVAVGRGRSE